MVTSAKVGGAKKEFLSGASVELLQHRECFCGRAEDVFPVLGEVVKKHFTGKRFSHRVDVKGKNQARASVVLRLSVGVCGV